jgi:hypothetical protein
MLWACAVLWNQARIEAAFCGLGWVLGAWSEVSDRSYNDNVCETELTMSDTDATRVHVMGKV